VKTKTDELPENAEAQAGWGGHEVLGAGIYLHGLWRFRQRRHRLLNAVQA